MDTITCIPRNNVSEGAMTSEAWRRAGGVLFLIGVRGDVGLGEETAERLVAADDLAHPPVGVLLVEDGDDVASLQLQLLSLLRLEVVARDHLRPDHVLQIDGLRSADGCRSMVLDELVQRVKLDNPQEVFAGTVPQHLEVLHLVREFD
jgi:hypothetical protein